MAIIIQMLPSSGRGGIIEGSSRTGYSDKLLLFDGVSIGKFLLRVNNNILSWDTVASTL